MPFCFQSFERLRLLKNEPSSEQVDIASAPRNEFAVLHPLDDPEKTTREIKEREEVVEHRAGFTETPQRLAFALVAFDRDQVLSGVVQCGPLRACSIRPGDTSNITRPEDGAIRNGCSWPFWDTRLSSRTNDPASNLRIAIFLRNASQKDVLQRFLLE